MCTRLIRGGSLVCTNTDPAHDPDGTTGHTFAASWTADRHDETEAHDE